MRKTSANQHPEPLPDRFNIVRYCLAGNAERQPDKTALIVVKEQGERRFSFGEMFDEVTRLAAGFRASGLEAGARVVIRLEDSADFALAFFALIAAGLVPVPSSAQLTSPEAGFLLADSEASALIVSDALALGEKLPRRACRVIDSKAFAALKALPGPGILADTGAEETAFLIYTSGTSDRPKGVLHAHRSAWGRRPMIEGWTGLGNGDVMLHAGRLNWTYTLGVGLMDPWSVGATAVLYDGPKDPCAWLTLIERYGVTIFAAVPSVYRRILKYCNIPIFDLSSLRYCLAAGEVLSPERLSAWREATGKELYEAFGMSEVSTYISSGPGTPILPGSPGRPQPGRRVAILPVEGGEDPLSPGQVGLLAVHRSDPGLMLAYWRRPDEEAAVYRGEWFVGGDLAAIDAEGYVWYHGRNDDLMNAFGVRVSPLEVERVLSECPSVAEVAVAEVSVRPEVSVITAFVVPQGPGRIDAKALLSWAEGRLADYKRPREVRFLPELPRTANGKLLRRRLAEAALDGPVRLEDLTSC